MIEEKYTAPREEYAHIKMNYLASVYYRLVRTSSDFGPIPISSLQKIDNLEEQYQLVSKPDDRLEYNQKDEFEARKIIESFDFPSDEEHKLVIKHRLRKTQKPKGDSSHLLSTSKEKNQLTVDEQEFTDWFRNKS